MSFIKPIDVYKRQVYVSDQSTVVNAEAVSYTHLPTCKPDFYGIHTVDEALSNVVAHTDF